MSTVAHDEQASHASAAASAPAPAPVAPRRGNRMKKPPVHMQQAEAATSDDQATQGTSAGATGSTEAYCVCRGGDDGKPMVNCAECEDWFHFRCVGLTQKVADCLATYVCAACQARTGRTSTTLPTDSANDAALDGVKASTSDAGVETAKFYGEAPPGGASTVAASAPAKSAVKRKASASVVEMPAPAAPTSTEQLVLKRSRTASAAARASPPKSSSPSASRRPPAQGSPTPAAAAVASSSSPGTTRPVAPKNNRKTSATTSRKASVTAAEAQGAAVRGHATQQFTATLTSIFTSATTASTSSDVVSPADIAAQSPADRAATYARQLESRFFELYSEPAPAGASSATLAGKAYKDKLRTLLFNLKDKANTSLHQRIASGSVTAHELAGFSSEELANEQRKLLLEQAKKENLEQSVLKGQESGPRRKMTHKGEVDIEYEAGTLESAEAEAEDRRLRKEREKRSAAEAAAAARSPTIAEFGTRDSETPSGLPGGGMGEKRASFGGLPSSNAFSPTPGVQQSPTQQFDFAGLWNGGSQSPEAEGGGEMGGENNEAGEEQPLSTDEAMPESGHTAATDDFIDSMLGLPSSPRGAGASPTRENPVAWKGAMSMPDVGGFYGSVQQLAGLDLRNNERAWQYLFPSSHSAIEGRLPSNVAEEYLVQSHHASRTELVACIVEPCFDAAAASVEPPNATAAASSFPDAPRTAEANVEAFGKLASYFHARGRYGVLACAPHARGRIVKDFYVTSLLKDAPLPEWLTLLEAQHVPAINERSQDLLVLVAVIFRGSLDETPRQAGNATPSVSTDEPYRPLVGAGAGTPLGASGGATASADVSKLFAGGSNVLQDLLRAVGGGAAADPSVASTGAAAAAYSGAPPAALASVPAPAPGGENQMAAPTAAALSQLETGKLEAVLAANPSLVDQLLSTLNGGAAAAASPQAPMPGLPPARPQGMFAPPHMHDQAYPGAPHMQQQQPHAYHQQPQPHWGGPGAPYTPAPPQWQQPQHQQPPFAYGLPPSNARPFSPPHGAPQYGGGGAPPRPFAPGPPAPYGAPGVRPGFAGAPGFAGPPARPGGPPAGAWGRPAPRGRGW